jgi:hypothetical protein
MPDFIDNLIERIISIPGPRRKIRPSIQSQDDEEEELPVRKPKFRKLLPRKFSWKKDDVSDDEELPPLKKKLLRRPAKKASSSYRDDGESPLAKYATLPIRFGESKIDEYIAPTRHGVFIGNVDPFEDHLDDVFERTIDWFTSNYKPEDLDNDEILSDLMYRFKSEFSSAWERYAVAEDDQFLYEELFDKAVKTALADLYGTGWQEVYEKAKDL